MTIQTISALLGILALSVASVQANKAAVPAVLQEIGKFDSKDGASCKLQLLAISYKAHALIVNCTCDVDSNGLAVEKKYSYVCSYYYKGTDKFEKCSKEKLYRETEDILRGLCLVYIFLYA